MKSIGASGAAFGALAAVMLGLSSCVIPAPPFAVVPPPPPYVEAVPVPPPPAVYRRCAPGWHWVGAHHNRWGRWIRGHCVHNW